MLSKRIPSSVYGGGVVDDPATTVFLWRTCRFPVSAKGGVLGFFVDDYRFECLWRRPEFYTQQLLAFGWGAVLSPDFSTWQDDPLVVQAYNIYRSRALSVKWQNAGINIIPVLSWSAEPSFLFCFRGIPQHAPVCATECRTAGQHDADRRRFLVGLTEGVGQIRPATVLIYGGQQHRYWLQDRLPPGPAYHLIDSWTDARGKIRAAQEREARERNQLDLFGGGKEKWADVAQQVAAARNAAAEKTKATRKASEAILVAMNNRNCRERMGTNRDTRMKVLEWKMRAHLLREDKAYFHSLSDADLTTLLSQASDLDRELICLVMVVPEDLMVQVATEMGQPG
jgi:hypothetical protein